MRETRRSSRLLIVCVIVAASGVAAATASAPAATQIGQAAVPDSQFGGYCFAGGDDGDDATYFWPSFSQCNADSAWTQTWQTPMPWLESDTPEQYAFPSADTMTLTSFNVSIFAFGPEYGGFIGWSRGGAPIEYDLRHLVSITNVTFYGECPQMSEDCDAWAFAYASHDEPRTCVQNPRYTGPGGSGVFGDCSVGLHTGVGDIEPLDSLPFRALVATFVVDSVKSEGVGDVITGNRWYLNASATTGPPGVSRQYQWRNVSGATTTTSSPTVSIVLPPTIVFCPCPPYTWELTVTAGNMIDWYTQ